MSFVLSFPDGTMHQCTGRITPQRSRAQNRSGVGAVERWQIDVVSGPNMWEAFRSQTDALVVRMEDGRVGRVVIVNDAKLHGVGELSGPEVSPL